MEVLDLGSGTGNFARYMLKNNVGAISLIDGSKGMMAVAKEKLKSFAGKIDYKLTMLPEIPYQDDTFDGALLNMVYCSCTIHRSYKSE